MTTSNISTVMVSFYFPVCFLLVCFSKRLSVASIQQPDELSHTHFSHTPVTHTDDVTSFLKNIYNVRNTISLSYYIVLSKSCEKIGLRWVGLMLLYFL